MSFTYPAGILSKTPVTPAGPYAEGAASGVWKLNEVAYWIKQGLWPNASNPAPNDPYFQYVTSLLHGDGTNGGQNNTFLDSSTNAFTITRNGNTTQGSFSPYGSNWGNYIGGDGDYLTVTNAAGLQLGSNNYTIECWVFNSDTSKTQATLISKGDTFSEGTEGWRIWLNGTTANFWVGASTSGTGNSNSPIVYSSSGAVPVNTWTHIAVSRSGSSHYMFINGALVSTATDSYTIATSGNLLVGSWVYNPVIARTLSGYLSNVRVVNGSAVYTSAFTPSTTPLTAVTNTSLLTCQSNRFVDNSTNAYTVTPTSDVQVTRFSPFAPTYATQYSASTIGGSGYFDGTGDYLTGGTTSLALGTNNFSLEFWCYQTGYVGEYDNLFTCSYAASADNYKYMSITNGAYHSFLVGDNSSSWLVNISFTAPPLNQWNHYAVTRSGSSWALFVNGTRVGTATYAGSVPTINYTYLMNNPTYSVYAKGYMSNFRIVNGTAVYDPSSSTITVPTSPVTAISNTSFLANFTNAAIYDNAELTDWETAGNAQISTSVKKYGTGSISFDGTGDYVQNANDYNDFAFGSGNFTIETWVYFNSVTGNIFLYDGRPNGVDTTQPAIYVYNGNLIYYANGADCITTSANFLQVNTWYHIAVSRAGTSTKMFVNGTQVGSTYSDSTVYTSTTGTPRLGAAPNNSNYLNGYMDDVRVTKGYARYWENFTPPAAALPNFGGAYQVPTQDPQFNYTTLLLPGNGTNGAQNNTFLDSSTNAFTITRNGNTTQGTFTPFSQTGWGNYFGTGNYLDVGSSNTSVSFGTSDFTIEGWFYFDSLYSESALLWGKNVGWTLYNYPNGYLQWGTTSPQSPANLLTSTIPIRVGTWQHIAVTRASNTVSLWINGNFAGSVSNSSNYSASGNLEIGRSHSGESLNGYASNVRVTKGAALYTANFTPSTTPLTTTVSSGTVSVLTCQSNRFIDNSTNAFAITVSGTPQVQAFSPFAPTAAYSTSTVGGSGYFDGTGDYLSTSTTQIIPATGDFSIDGWFYYYGANYPVILSQGTSGNAGSLLFYVNSKRLVLQIGASDIVAGANTVKPYEWNYVSATRTGSTATIYVNGTQVATGTLSGTIQNSALNVGLDLDGNSAACNISNLRISTSIRTYSGAPTAPVTNDANTKLLLNFTNAAITDATAKNAGETSSSAQISTAQSKFGGSSMLFDGDMDCILFPSSPLYNFGTGDFTIEGWYNWSSLSQSGDGVMVLFVCGQSGTSQAQLKWTTSNSLIIDINAGNRFTYSFTPVVGTWYHFALVRTNGSTYTLYVNGNSVVSGTYAYTQVQDQMAVGGINWANNYSFKGYVNDFRVTKGYARYVQNFTPPAQADQLY